MSTILSYNRTGSVPTSPSCSRSSFSPLGHSTPHRTGSNPDLLDAINMSPEMTASPFTRLKELALQGAQMALSNGASDEESPSRSKRNLQRSHTIAKPEKVLRGQEMDICTDCKMMIMEIIRASRSCLMAAPSKLNRERVFGSCPPPRKPNRDFHLNLKPVYKPSHKKWKITDAETSSQQHRWSRCGFNAELINDEIKIYRYNSGLLDLAGRNQDFCLVISVFIVQAYTYCIFFLLAHYNSTWTFAAVWNL